MKEQQKKILLLLSWSWSQNIYPHHNVTDSEIGISPLLHYRLQFYLLLNSKELAEVMARN